MRSRSLVVVAALLLSLSAAAPLAQGAKPSGAASPQEAVAVLQKATAANDMLQALPVISPSGLKQIANEGVTGLLMVLAFSDPDDAMPGSPKPSKAELDAKRKQYRQAVDLATQTLKPYGLDALIGKPVLAPEIPEAAERRARQGRQRRADHLALWLADEDRAAARHETEPQAGTAGQDRHRDRLQDQRRQGHRTEQCRDDGFRAHRRALVRRAPADEGRRRIGASGASSSAAPAGQGQPAAPRATASGKEPEVVVGGIQIARVVVPDNDFSAKPFHADNGTMIVLWVKMPAGQGLIEIDEDASVLQSVTDDKGSNIGGKFGSFPEEFKDGTGGIIEIESSGFAAPGATALLAEGTLAMTVATGTRKTRVAKVQLQNDAKFTFGKTPIVVAEVQTQDDSQTFTLKLPRQVMTEIKNVVFLDAKGQPIEGSRTGSGYMNDAAEMGFTVKTAAKTLTLEFEAWQGLRTIKVPFKVKAGLGLD